jgi:DNA-nicking Smr family endonuclease
LHGHTQESAPAAIARFLRAAQKRGATTVIIITGMGRGGEGVLKRRLPDWLASPDLRGVISGYAPAHRQHGGAGAFYVFVKRLRESEN